MRKRLRVGVDFDGVVAYNPLRLVRAPIKWFKKRVLGRGEVSFFVPKNWWQRGMWQIIHGSSIWPAKGVTRLKQMVAEQRIEAHLITARYDFLKVDLDRWLERHGLLDIFITVNSNLQNEQPHEYKLRIVKDLKLDVYVEDNLDVVEYLASRTKAKIFWIYNLLDKNHHYPYKFPYLEKALEAISK